jgi:hypothetical protein
MQLFMRAIVQILFVLGCFGSLFVGFKLILTLIYPFQLKEEMFGGPPVENHCHIK